MLGRSRPNNRHVVKVAVYAGDPLVNAVVSSLDRTYGNALAGRSGRIVAGELFSRRYTGDNRPLQSFKGGANVGLTNPRPSPNRGLPNTAAPPATAPNRVVSLLARTPA